MEGRIYWGEVDTVYLSGQRNRLEVWGMLWRVMLLECYGWVENQDGIFVSKSAGEQLYVKGNLGVSS